MSELLTMMNNSQAEEQRQKSKQAKKIFLHLAFIEELKKKFNSKKFSQLEHNLHSIQPAARSWFLSM